MCNKRWVELLAVALESSANALFEMNNYLSIFALIDNYLLNKI